MRDYDLITYIMRSFRVAASLICIPRLFISLLLFPLLVSFGVVYLQLLVSTAFLRAANVDSSTVAKSIKTDSQGGFARRLLFGKENRLKPLIVCRWIQDVGTDSEEPPAEDCAPDRLDVALQVRDPRNFPTETYASLMEGNVERLHVCRSCAPDVVLIPEKGETKIYSVWGLILYSAFHKSQASGEKFVEAIKSREQEIGLMGDVHFFAPGFTKPLSLSDLNTDFIIVCNFAGLIVLTLWLAIRAHRKILDYFARNGALLPMVAATGKSAFYGAMWIVTGVRVAAFLCASVPAVLFTLRETSQRKDFLDTFGNDWITAVLWIVATVASLGLATMVSSIAELQHRHNIVGFLYRYLPISLCAIGALLWAGSFLVDADVAAWIRNCIAALPILGAFPVLVSPLFTPKPDILAVHAILAAWCLLQTFRINARWFAAHLEEL